MLPTLMVLCNLPESPCKNTPTITWGEWLLCMECYEAYRRHLMHFIKEFKDSEHDK